MDSKFWGAYRIARSVRVRPSGSLTLLAGYLSQRPGRASALQSAINADIEALVRGLALEYAPLRVNAVSPGLLRTPLWEGMDVTARERMCEAATQRLPVGRVGRRPTSPRRCSSSPATPTRRAPPCTSTAAEPSPDGT